MNLSTSILPGQQPTLNMKHPLLLLGTALIGGGMIPSCTYNTYVPPPPPERHIHHYTTSTPSTKSASVGGSSGSSSSAEGFKAVTPPHTYSQ